MRKLCLFPSAGAQQAITIGSLLALIFLLVLDRSHEPKPATKVTRDLDLSIHTRSPSGSLKNAVASNATRPGVLEDEYSCSKDKPCSNGACCGSEGVCGYGPTCCGGGCTSNCDAHAECGQYAQKPGQECPLNVCCSQFGFCGTTSEFCNDECQSHCVEHPKPPPPVGNDGGNVLKRGR